MTTFISPQRHNIATIEGDVIVKINNQQFLTTTAYFTKNKNNSDSFYAGQCSKTGRCSKMLSAAKITVPHKATTEFFLDLVDSVIDNVTSNYTRIPAPVRTISLWGAIWIFISEIDERCNLHITCAIYPDRLTAIPMNVGDGAFYWGVDEETHFITKKEELKKEGTTSPKNEIKFIHGRWYDTRVGEGNSGLVPTGGYTIAYRDNGNGTYTFGGTRCSEDDVFCKQTGRDVAAVRLNTARFSNGTKQSHTIECLSDKVFYDGVVKAFASLVYPRQRHYTLRTKK